MPVIYKLQRMGVLCGIQLTFGNALMNEWCMKGKLSETPSWLYGNHSSKSLGQYILIKLCLGILWDSYPSENSALVLSFSGPIWVEEKESMKVQDGFPAFLIAIGFSAGFVWVVETKRWMCCPSHPSSLDSSCPLTRNSGFERQSGVAYSVWLLGNLLNWLLSIQEVFLCYKSRKHLWCIYSQLEKKIVKSLEINFALGLGEMTWGLRKSSFNLC